MGYDHAAKVSAMAREGRIRTGAEEREYRAKVAAEELLYREKMTQQTTGAVLGSVTSLHGHIEQRIRQLEDEVVQLRALRNWLPNELPAQVEDALWRRFQWGPR